ncbi:MAG: ABC transporter permease [Methyloligellaceae bacterium]
MTLALPAETHNRSSFAGSILNSIWLQLALAVVAAYALATAWSPADHWPVEWAIPVKVWITDFFRWLDKTATFGLFTVKEATRTFAWVLKQPLIWSEYLLFKGAKAFQILPVIWIAIAAIAGFIVSRIWSGKAAVWVALGILGIVFVDGLPYILQSLTKALRIEPWMEPRTFVGIADLPGHWLQGIIDSIGGRKVKHIPWIAVIAGFGILAHWIGGWRLTITVLLCLGYLAFTGLWRESMKTFSLVMVAVPFSAALGLWLGVLVTRSKTAARIFSPMFDLMQATPHLAYLVPVVVMFGAGQVPALIATVIFAMPPMARCTILAINTVPSDVVEAGHMSGCTPRQLLWKVQLPASQRTLLLGLNQVIMQTLAMVVIASLVGAAGLGHKLLFSLQQLKLGFATMQGIAIVLMAVVLDRLTAAYANRATDYEHHDTKNFIQQHSHLLLFIGVFVLAILAAMFRIEPLFEWLGFDSARNTSTLNRAYFLIDRTDALELDKVIKAFTYSLIDYIRPVRDWLTINMLIPMRDFYQSIPWPAAVAVVGVLAYRFGGWSLTALTSALLVGLVVLIGNWEFALTTFYYVSTAMVLCALIGVTVGITATQDMHLLEPRVTTGDVIGALLFGVIWAIFGYAGAGATGTIVGFVLGAIAGAITARLVRSSKIVLFICDLLQTFPSFIYLIPAIMLFRVGELAIIFAIIPYAMVPAIRYTYLGLMRIPEVTIEAARMSGATPLQQLWKVKLPIAIPEIMLGVNQTIMMALAMTAITALIGGSDLGQEIYRALPTSDAGRGVMAGLGIAAMGIVADRLIGSWAQKRKDALGIA